MSTARIVARYFGPGPGGMWDRLAAVLAASARRHCPGWEIDIRSCDLAPMSSPLGLDHSVYNTQKLDGWVSAVSAAAPGDRLLLMDVDTAILRPLDDVWALPFDLAYTNKPSGARMPFNAGVVFVRVSRELKAFMAVWAAENLRMLEDPQHHQVWRPYYGGINQAALGFVFREQRQAGLNVLRLPCAEWNCEDESWPAFDQEVTRIVHFKGELRRALFGKRSAQQAWTPMIQAWKSLESEPDAEGAPPADQRQIVRGDLENTTIQPETLEVPLERPPLSRKQRREAERLRQPGGRDARA